MSDTIERKVRRKRANDKRYLAVLRDPCALIDGWICPCCKREFRSQDSCPHGWADVKKSNDRFLLNREGK